MLKILMVGLGGFAGSICRYLVSDMTQKLFPDAFFPYGTLAVNVIGCLLIGLLGGLAESTQVLTPGLKVLIFIGFLGGFTTYSTFGFEIFNLSRDGSLIPAAANLMLHLVLGFGAVWAGFSLSKIFT